MDPVRPDRPLRVGGDTIIRTIGEGPRGAVHLGQETAESAPRVIKLLAPDTAREPDVVQRLRSLTRVSGPHVARVLDAGMWEGRPYVVREHVAGRSLAELVAAEGPLPRDALERMAAGVLTALTAIHLEGLTHGGLTPYNVILAPDGPKVTDVAVGPPAGELGYRSPEQLNGEAYGPYSDVFSWAAVVVFAAAGRPPFGHDPHSVMNAAPDLGNLPEPVRSVVASALAKPVGQRPTAQAALLGLLGSSGQAAASPGWGPVGAPQVSEPSRPGPGSDGPTRSFPVALAAGLAIVVLLSVAGIWGASVYAGKQPMRPAAATVPAPAGTGEPPPSSLPEVTVPWAGTPDPQDTAAQPFEMPTEPTTGSVPELSTAPMPALPTPPVPQPAVTVTKQTTVTASPTASAAKKQQESPKPTRTQPKPTKSTTSAPPPSPQPSKTAPPEVPAGGSPLDIHTNYAWARGSVSWNGTVATADGQLQDTTQYESQSWVRIAYRAYVSGAWKVRYAQPDPYTKVSNGQSAHFSFSMSGPIKDVQWDLCSSRLGKTFCTGWS